MDDLGCAIREPCAFLSRFWLFVFFRSLLGYLKDCNVAAHSVDRDIFYVVINLSAGSKSFIITFIPKQCQIVVCKLKSVLVCINFMHNDASMAKCDVTGPGITNNLITLNHKPN